MTQESMNKFLESLREKFPEIAEKEKEAIKDMHYNQMYILNGLKGYGWMFKEYLRKVEEENNEQLS